MAQSRCSPFLRACKSGAPTAPVETPQSSATLPDDTSTPKRVHTRLFSGAASSAGLALQSVLLSTSSLPACFSALRSARRLGSFGSRAVDWSTSKSGAPSYTTTTSTSETAGMGTAHDPVQPGRSGATDIRRWNLRGSRLLDTRNHSTTRHRTSELANPKASRHQDSRSDMLPRGTGLGYPDDTMVDYHHRARWCGRYVHLASTQIRRRRRSA